MNTTDRIARNELSSLASGQRLRAFAVTLLATMFFTGCAAYSGGHLVPGKSTAAEVETTMGAPGEKVVVAGVTRWFYPRGPVGQYTYAVNVGADGIVQGVEQTLTYENVQKLKAGGMTAAEVRALLGPPNKITRFEAKERDAWEYRMVSVDWKVLTLEMSGDGVLRGVMFMDDPTQYLAPGGADCARC